MICNDPEIIKNSGGESDTRKVFICSSPLEFISEVTKLHGERHYHNSSHSNSWENGSWTLFDGFDEFDKVFRGLKKTDLVDNFIRDRLAKIVALSKVVNYEDGYSNVFRDDFDVSGFYVDVGRYLSGEPECFMNSSKSVNELVDIHITGSIHCYVKAQQYLDDVEKLARLVYILKNKGCNSRIYIYEDSTYGAAKILLKDYKDSLDIRKIILCMIPDFFRRYVFMLFELDPNLDTWGYGRTEKHFFDKWKKIFSPNVFNIDILQADSLSITDDLLNDISKCRDVKKIVSMINNRSE